MEPRYNKVIKGILLSSMACLMTLLSPVSAGEAVKKGSIESAWQEFHSVVGKCTMLFPNFPEHVSEKMKVPDEGYELRYDAYISAMGKEAVYMLLIAQYPDFVDETYAQMSLEGFLNGILTHNPGNQLLFADLLLVNGHQALDFFVRTGGVYFKGRALMIKNSLYLMAMECEIQSYDEGRFNHFVNSFKLVK